MSRVLIFEDNGSTIEVITNDDEPLGAERVSVGGKVVEAAKITFDEAVSSARQVAEAVWRTFNAPIQRPNELELEFGLKITGSAGAVVSSASAEATLHIRCMWKSAESE